MASAANLVLILCLFCIQLETVTSALTGKIDGTSGLLRPQRHQQLDNPKTEEDCGCSREDGDPHQHPTQKPTTRRTPPTPSTTTTRALTTTTPFTCTIDGYFPNRQDCLKFIRCTNGVRYDFDCPPGTSWYADQGLCNYMDMNHCAH